MMEAKQFPFLFNELSACFIPRKPIPDQNAQNLFGKVPWIKKGRNAEKKNKKLINT